MTARGMPFCQLAQKVLEQLKDQGYLESTLTTYRRIYNRIQSFLNDAGTEIYTQTAGNAFLQRLDHVCNKTFSSYTCAVRRLDDYNCGVPYRCHHGEEAEQVTDIFSDILEKYLSECQNNGNKPATVSAKKRACILFLNYVANSGCSDLSLLDPDLVLRALLIYSNKDCFAIIRLFLCFLAENAITQRDFSVLVPHYKRPVPLPTVYTPGEIGKLENTVDTNTNSGKRDLAIIRLATRMGLRSGDIARLKWSEIDFSTGFISIIQEKTDQPLSLHMPEQVIEALSVHLDNTSANDGYVFHSMTAPYAPITTSTIRHTVNKYFVRAGINTSGKKHGPHSLRSSLASSMVNDGTSYETVRRILGHSDPNAIKHYARADIENLRLCSIEPPKPKGLFNDYLSGKKVICRV